MTVSFTAYNSKIIIKMRHIVNLRFIHLRLCQKSFKKRNLPRFDQNKFKFLASGNQNLWLLIDSIQQKEWLALIKMKEDSLLTPTVSQSHEYMFNMSESPRVMNMWSTCKILSTYLAKRFVDLHKPLILKFGCRYM